MDPKILFVEDDPDIRHLVTTILKLEGYPVLVAASATEMYDRLSLRPAVVILDTNLPDADVFDLCRMLKATDPDRPVILLSAPMSAAIERLAQEAGADAVLRKPFGVDDLTHAIRSALAHDPPAAGSPSPSLWGSPSRW
ncbi:MAG TPA: response regulator transcription factor [Thermodesulfobacteriota bacterium]|nr:response regulator transcription factor [Thermodesulfobacteriota bacterium]